MDNRLGNMVAVVDVLVSPEDLDSPGEGMLGWFFLLGGSGRRSFENFLYIVKKGADRWGVLENILLCARFRVWINFVKRKVKENKTPRLGQTWRR